MEITEEKFINFVKQKVSGLTTTDFAFLYGMSAKKFNILLENFNIQYKRKYNEKDKWILKKEFANKNLMIIKYSSYIKENGDVLTFKTPPKWTQKGILYIYYFLKEKGINPVKLEKTDDIEQKIEQLTFI